MDRLACIDVAALPLQVLFRRRPAWRNEPAAVVDQDSPNGVIRFVNEAARKSGVLPGQRYAAAFALCVDLRAAVVGPPEIAAAVAEVERALQDFSPRVESARDSPGTFFVDASGLRLLEPSLHAWAKRIVATLRTLGFSARAAVGFTRLGVLAGARTARLDAGAITFPDATAERVFVRDVPLARLDVEPKLRDRLAQLGVATVGAFADLPAAGVRARFGPAAEELHRDANDRGFAPLLPAPLFEALERRIVFDLPVDDLNSLLFLLKQMLDELLLRLAARGEVLAEFTMSFRPERATEDVTATLKPAAPTLDGVLLLKLATLHFERAPPTRGRAHCTGVDEFGVRVTGAPAKPEQLALFREHPTRDLAAANRALAAIRSRFGENAVQRAVLREGHLPEATFRFEPLATLAFPSPRPVLEKKAIRRVFAAPLRLTPPNRRHHDDGWLVQDLKQGAVVKCDGPYVISGGWWARAIHREYLFVHTLSGEVLWVFFDKMRRGWYLHGALE